MQRAPFTKPTAGFSGPLICRVQLPVLQIVLVAGVGKHVHLGVVGPQLLPQVPVQGAPGGAAGNSAAVLVARHQPVRQGVVTDLDAHPHGVQEPVIVRLLRLPGGVFKILIGILRQGLLHAF